MSGVSSSPVLFPLKKYMQNSRKKVSQRETCEEEVFT